MRKFLKYLFRTVLIIVIVLLLLPAVLYIPAVQRYAKDKLTGYVSEKLDMKVNVGSLSLRFPLDLTLEKVFAGKTEADTLAYFEKLNIDVGLRGIFRKELAVHAFLLEGVKFNLRNETTGMVLQVDAGELTLQARRISLKEKVVDITRLVLDQGKVVLMSGRNAIAQDTVSAAPFDWKFHVREIDFSAVEYRMQSAGLPELYAGVGEGRIRQGMVDIAGQQVQVDSVDIRRGNCRITLAEQEETPRPVVQNIADTVGLWSVWVHAVGVENYAFRMSDVGGKNFELNLSDIGVHIDSVYNRGAVVQAELKQLQLVRTEGGQIDRMRASVDLAEEETRVGGLYLQTPYSTIRLDAVSEAPLSQAGQQSPLYLKLAAVVGMRDAGLFWKDMPEQIGNKRLQLNANLIYSRNEINIRDFKAEMPGNFILKSKGNLSAWGNLQKISGHITVDGEMKDMTFLNSVLPDKIHLPENILVGLTLSADRGKIVPDLRMSLEKGNIQVAGTYSFPRESYDIRVRTDSLNISSFLPADSIGLLTADMQFSGQGYRWGKTNAHLMLEVGQFEYKRHVYEDIRLAAELRNARLQGEIRSDDPALFLDMNFKADSVGHRYLAEMHGDIKNADLKVLNLTPEDFALAWEMDVKIVLGEDEDYLLNVNLEDVRLDDGRGFYNLGGLAVRVESDREMTQADFVSGDFRLAFQVDTILRQVLPVFTNVLAEFRQQFELRKFDMERIQPLLPQFWLKVAGNVNNVIGRYLRLKGMIFKEVTLDAAAGKGEDFHLKTRIVDPVFNKVGFDSVTFEARQQDPELVYEVRAINPRGIVKDLYDVQASGYIRQNRFEIAVRQQNRKGEVGVDIGADLTLQDSSLTISLFPENPILGYSTWMVNAGNQITVNTDGQITADLRMAYQEKLFSIQSLADYNNEKDRLQLEINGIDLAAVSDVVPFFPNLSGILNTDLLFYAVDEHMIADGELSILDFYYQQQRIGDLGLDINYSAANQFTDHAVDFTLYLDAVRRAIAKGEISTSDQNRKVAVDIDIPSLPLYIVNAFVSGDLIKLGGDLYGKMAITGLPEQLNINGGLAFRDAQAEVVMLGTGFSLDSVLIPIQDGKVIFNKFSFTAPNKQLMWLNGDIALLPFSDMRLDLTLNARNFQVVNVKKNPVSLLYGKAYTDLDIGLKGPFTALNLSGNVNLLNNTSITYVLKNSTPELKDRSLDLVRFVSFGDTTLMQKDLLTNRINTTGFTMKLFVEIGNTVNVVINLSEDGNNQVVIQGGGNLIYAMNPEEGNNLSGKYTLSGGIVRYGIPVVGEKTFNIQSGSYVEWSGPLENPVLHIVASEAVRVSVTEDNQSSRLVNFDAIIRIEGNLKQPQITFDLSAPNDQAIQGQLAAFSAEERTKQAMNLLIYGTYSGPGTVNTGNNASNTLNNFVEKELNQWSRKYLKNAGLTFGIDSYNQIGAGGQEVKRTDYSYQFSKQLFNDKVNVKIGGRVSTDNDAGSSMEQNLVDDIAIEYMFSKNRNWFLKVFRHTNYESVLEGEVTQTGLGIVLRKSFRKVKDLFIRKSKIQSQESLKSHHTDGR